MCGALHNPATLTLYRGFIKQCWFCCLLQASESFNSLRRINQKKKEKEIKNAHMHKCSPWIMCNSVSSRWIVLPQEVVQNMNYKVRTLKYNSVCVSFNLGALTMGLVRQCQTIHGRDRICSPPSLSPEWLATLFFIILGIISLSITCALLVLSHWHQETAKYARWIAFAGSEWFGLINK